MKNLKFIIYIVIGLFLTLSCDKQDNVNEKALNISFIKGRIDVGENSGILEIPLQLTGIKSDVQVNITVDIATKDGTAINGTDYRLISNKIDLSQAGKKSVMVEIINNTNLSSEIKTFTVSISNVSNNVIKGLSEVKVYIINDDVELQNSLVGKYTLKAEDNKAVKLSSEVGKVEIIEDATLKGRYLVKNLSLVNKDKIMPLTLNPHLYLMVQNNIITMPENQSIGDYGSGEAFFYGITEKDDLKKGPVELIRKDDDLVFKTVGVIGIVFDDKDGIKALSYYLKNLVLEKVK